MKLYSVLLVAFLAFVRLSLSQLQVHYAPAEIRNVVAGVEHTLNNYLQRPVSHTKRSPATKSWNHWNNSRSSHGFNYNSTSYRYNKSSKSRTYNATQDGHLWLGTINRSDRLLFNQTYFKSGSLLGSQEKIIDYPKHLPKGSYRNGTISAIRCYNKFYDGNTAKAKIINGGIGKRYVKIKIYSQWRKGFRYLVQIFGH